MDSTDPSANPSANPGVVRKVSENIASAAKDVIENKVLPSPVVNAATEKYGEFKRTYPAAGDKLEQAEKTVHDVVVKATQRGEKLVDELDTMLQKEYEAKIKSPYETVRSTAETELSREEVQKVKESSVSLFVALVNLLVMYATRVLIFVDDKVDSHLPALPDEKPETFTEGTPLKTRALVLGEKIWHRGYTKLAFKAEMEKRQVNIKDWKTLVYAVMVIELGALLYVLEFVGKYSGIGSSLVRGYVSALQAVIDIAKPVLPGSTKTSAGESVGVIPSGLSSRHGSNPELTE